MIIKREELDRKVAEILDGCYHDWPKCSEGRVRNFVSCRNCGMPYHKRKHYTPSTDANQALELLEELGTTAHLIKRHNHLSSVLINDIAYSPNAIVTRHESLPIAICLAYLAAKIGTTYELSED